MRRLTIVLVIAGLAVASHYRLLSEVLTLTLAMFRVVKDEPD